MLLTLGTLAGWFDPFRVLGPQVIVDLLFELGVGVDLVRHDQKFRYGAQLFLSGVRQNRGRALALCADGVAV